MQLIQLRTNGRHQRAESLPVQNHVATFVDEPAGLLEKPVTKRGDVLEEIVVTRSVSYACDARDP
jgi:hypothetical protein